MAYVVNVLYPRKEGSTFDMDYYLSTHMPLVDQHWKKYGLESWTIVEFPEGPYSVQAILHWPGADAWEKASGSDDATPVFGDIPKFSSEQPTVCHGHKKSDRK